jgi:hypothetical protein
MKKVVVPFLLCSTIAGNAFAFHFHNSNTKYVYAVYSSPVIYEWKPFAPTVVVQNQPVVNPYIQSPEEKEFMEGCIELTSKPTMCAELWKEKQ